MQIRAVLQNVQIAFAICHALVVEFQKLRIINISLQFFQHIAQIITIALALGIQKSAHCLLAGLIQFRGFNAHQPDILFARARVIFRACDLALFDKIITHLFPDFFNWKGADLIRINRIKSAFFTYQFQTIFFDQVLNDIGNVLLHLIIAVQILDADYGFPIALKSLADGAYFLRDGQRFSQVSNPHKIRLGYSIIPGIKGPGYVGQNKAYGN
ncbi:hypothetical protein KAR34_09605 [bacterium]|nr:hypothetical protein [bacterium]